MFEGQTSISLFTAALLFATSPVAADPSATRPANVEHRAAGDEPLKFFPPVPNPSLAVPAGHHLAFHYDAIGVQIYVCVSTPTGYAWAFRAPEASLFDPRGRLVVTHFAGPTWESVGDRSRVVAKKMKEFTAQPGAIPELLLEATSHEGRGQMADVSFIQRLDTEAGLAPLSGCDAAHASATARVDYTATYFFYCPDGK